nr:PREDICTED: cholesterol 7-desaturase-like [Bemisia tabaci]
MDTLLSWTPTLEIDWPIILNYTALIFDSHLNATDGAAEGGWNALRGFPLILMSTPLIRQNWIIALCSFIFIICLINFTFFPANYYYDLSGIEGDAHFNLESRHIGLSTKKRLINRLRTDSKTANVPIYPNGWFCLLESASLRKNEVKYISALGENFAAFRASSGKVHIVDAYCPHLGANLGVGGMVDNDCITCPFHGWKFNGETGKCAAIPYSKCEIPESAKIRTWKSCEVNQLICVWYHAEGEEPTWEPQPIPEIEGNTYWLVGKAQYEVTTSIQDIMENVADFPHLEALHSALPFVGNRLDHPFWSKLFASIKMSVTGSWAVDSKKPHMSIARFVGITHFMGKVNLVRADVLITVTGPGILQVEIDSPFGRVIATDCITPLGPFHQRSLLRMYSHLTTMLPARFYFHTTRMNIERDFLVYNFKGIEAKPNVVKEGGQILEFRRWYNKFYTEHTPRLKFQVDTLSW